ncbi:hypothetical protein JCM10207_007577 [Rhodosporidiobolus poonsookiae]
MPRGIKVIAGPSYMAFASASQASSGQAPRASDASALDMERAGAARLEAAKHPPGAPPPAVPFLSSNLTTAVTSYVLAAAIDDLDITQPSINFSFKLETPFPGEWEVRGVGTNKSFTLGLVVENAPIGCIGQEVVFQSVFGPRMVSASKPLAASLPSGIYPFFPSQATVHQPVTLAVRNINVADLEDELPTYQAKNHRLYDFTTTIGSLDQPFPQDVCLVFPRTSATSPLRIWTRHDFLTRSSLYFDELSSDLAPASAKRARLSSGLDDDEDSDAETDTHYSNFRPSASTPQPTDEGDDEKISAVQEIKVTSISYTTVKVILGYFATGYIAFAPLKSTLSPARPDATQTHDEFLDAFEENPKNEDLPLPASPKSVYSAAVLLKLDALQDLALALLRASLSVETAALELVSSLALHDDRVLDVVVGYVVEHLAEVEKTDAYKQVMDEIKAGEKPKAAGVVIRMWEKQRENEAAKVRP